MIYLLLKKVLLHIFFSRYNGIIFILMYVLGNGSLDTKTLYNFGGLVKDGAFYRNITSMFLHIGIIHLVMNMWALILLGKQVENFYGHIKKHL